MTMARDCSASCRSVGLGADDSIRQRRVAPLGAFRRESMPQRFIRALYWLGAALAWLALAAPVLAKALDGALD